MRKFLTFLTAIGLATSAVVGVAPGVHAATPSFTVQDLGTGTAELVGGGAAAGEIRIAIERLRETLGDANSGKAATTAMANLAEAIQGLVHHMRSEQQMIRDWADAQAQQHGEIRRLLEMLLREDVRK